MPCYDMGKNCRVEYQWMIQRGKAEIDLLETWCYTHVIGDLMVLVLCWFVNSIVRHKDELGARP